MKFAYSALVFFSLAPIAFAQDMPLSMLLIDGEGWRKSDLTSKPPPAPQRPRDISGHQPRAIELSPDGGTVFAEHPGGKAVWAYRVGKNDELTGVEPYCPLRRHEGQKELAVTGLTVDTAGRIYAATPDGVQVFDPTGRLCGVLLLPAKGDTGHIRWTGAKKNLLTLRVSDVWYVRKLNATGAR